MSDGDYVLGTAGEEIERLGLQHRVWRPRMLAAFRRAGIGPGMSVIDVGAGPGYATLDLAEIVGPSGRVLALERSPAFADHLRRAAAARGLGWIEVREMDVAAEPFGVDNADATWCRWLLSFVADPRATLAAIAGALKPGGVALFHEYADYAAWRTMPPSADQERFRELVMKSWRDTGGEPDIALSLPGWLSEHGLGVEAARPHVEIVGRDDFAWQWPAAFMAVNARRLHQLGYVDAEEAERLATALDRLPTGALTITPLVAEILARKPG